MKALIAFSVLIIFNLAWACPNFSGHYTGTQNGERIDLTIVQQDCLTAQTTTVTPQETTNMTVITDGQFRVIKEEQGMQIIQAYSWQGNILTFIMNGLYQGQNFMTANGQISLDNQNNLVEVMTSTTPQGTQSQTITYVRN
ncbi:MAG: hypothetical protein WCG27_12225 [Pseudomonadota bacterium]